VPPHRIGYSQLGREVLVLQITDNPGVEEDEPEFYYTSTMHGNEETGYVLLLNLIDDLLTTYTDTPSTDHEIQVKHLIDSQEIWLNPLANPDGYVANSRYYNNGYDPNRNFPDPEEGDSADPDVFSASIETLDQMRFADAHSIVMSVNHHDGTEVVNYPWDTWYTRHADDAWFQLTSHAYADSCQADWTGSGSYMSGYDDGITNGADWYIANGTRQDYMVYYKGGREVTVEISNPQPAPAGDLVHYWNAHWQAMLDYMEFTLQGIRGLVTEADRGDPVAATITVVGHDEDGSWVYTDPEVGDYHRLIGAGTWDLEFSAEGYEPVTESGVVVTDGAPATRVDVHLTSLPRFTVTGLVTDADKGTAIEGADVRLAGSSFDPTTTGVNGAYSIPDVFEGEHSLRVSAAGYSTLEQAISLGPGSTVFDVQLASYTAVLDEDLEATDGGFTGSGSWQWGEDAEAGAASGAKVWGTVLGDDYTNNADWTLTSTEVEIPADIDTAELVFQHWYETEASWDGGNVSISVDGEDWEILDPNSYPDQDVDGLGNGVPGWSGAKMSWTEARFDLSAYIGHSIVLRWRFGSDGYDRDYRGWYLDDVQMLTTGGSPPGEIFADGFESGDLSAWSPGAR